jgi:o-succinylbenzoate synthase
MIQIQYKKHVLEFSFAAGTSRGVLHEKPSWLIKLSDTSNPNIVGYGECSIIPGLSVESVDEVEAAFNKIVEKSANGFFDQAHDFTHLPSIRFGIETAIGDLHKGGHHIIYPSAFTQGDVGIPINGLIWMGNVQFMNEQIARKIESGFTCLKMKIGAINFKDEVAVLNEIRKNFPADILELRVDANGAFDATNVFDRLDTLHKYHLHSIEQPVKAGQWDLMSRVCANSPFPVALDEELIGMFNCQKMNEMLTYIKPQYIILKPGLIGGFEVCDQWISLANSYKIGWWITSALEGNIGLNAIAQYTFSKCVSMPQGLGTGQLFTNNIASPLSIINGSLYYLPNQPWGQFPL